MLRYAFDKDIPIDSKMHFDVLIIGAGLAGLYTALNIDEDKSVAVLSKEGIEISNSWLAQGGIAAAVAEGDRPIFHVEDTLIAGAGLCDAEAVGVLCDEGPDDIHNLMKMTVPFDLNEDGDLSITREGGHRRNRIVHAGGDATGRETVKVLAAIAHSRPNITFIEYCCFVDMLTDENGVCGAVINHLDESLPNGGSFSLIATPNIAICTGGIGQVYRHSTNPAVATGDGIAAAYRAGAELKDMEFVQFHPTGLYAESGEGRSFLISEAVRGEGGLLYNDKGERYMVGRHELCELAPRDVVARINYSEIINSDSPCVYLDVGSLSREFFEKRFPTIYNECQKRGIDVPNQRIPVCPVQHYIMGGILTDLYGRTNVPGLYACGEAARTGVHGANRLASNSMLECLVFGRRAAEDIDKSGRIATVDINIPDDAINIPKGAIDIPSVRSLLTGIMDKYAYVVRTQRGLETARAQIETLLSIVENNYTNDRTYLELLNLLIVAEQIVKAAQSRKESVGAHFIEG